MEIAVYQIGHRGRNFAPVRAVLPFSGTVGRKSVLAHHPPDDFFRQGLSLVFQCFSDPSVTVPLLGCLEGNLYKFKGIPVLNRPVVCVLQVVIEYAAGQVKPGK